MTTTGTTQRIILWHVLVVVLLAAIASPAAASSFTFAIGSPVGTPSCGGVSDSGSSPVSGSLVCSPIGGASLFDASAAALFGYVGGSAITTVGTGYFGTSFGVSTQSTFMDEVTFTSQDPTLTQALVSANLAFSGTLNATNAANASVDVAWAMFGARSTLLFAANEDGVVRNDFSVVSGSVSGTSNLSLLNTGTFLVPLNVPLTMMLQLSTGAGVGGSGSPESASSRFSNSFEIPFGIDAFVLPNGVTANAGNWLVNNRRVGETAPTITPEPATWTLVALGLCCGAARLRRRRPSNGLDA